MIDGPQVGPWRQVESHDAAVAVRDLVDAAARHDGISAISGHVMDAVNAESAEYVIASRGVETAPDGVAVAVSGGDPAEVVVRPESRRRGLGSALVRAAVARQGSVWAYGDLPGAAAVADLLGLVRGRVLLQMRQIAAPKERAVSAPQSGEPLSTTPAIDATLPAGVRVRTFVPGQDEEAFLGVNARAFAWHPEQGRLDLAGLQSDMAQSWFDPGGFFLAVTGDGSTERVVGFHWTKVHPADPNPGPGGVAGPIGEIYVLGVDPDAGLRGVGTPLTHIGLEHLRRAGLDTVMLYVEGDNERARRLYERFGFTTFLTNVVYTRSAPPAR